MGRFMILESAWSAERQRHNQKIEQQRRCLNDGTAFDVYKRYIDHSDVARWQKQYEATFNVEYFGPAFCAISGQKRL
jgi:hypothetical protein